MANTTATAVREVGLIELRVQVREARTVINALDAKLDWIERAADTALRSTNNAA